MIKYFSFHHPKLAITIGTIPIRDSFGASPMDPNSELVISVQPGAEPASTRAQIEEAPMPRPSAPNLSTDLNEPSTSTAPTAPAAPIDFSESKICFFYNFLLLEIDN